MCKEKILIDSISTLFVPNYAIKKALHRFLKQNKQKNVKIINKEIRKQSYISRFVKMWFVEINKYFRISISMKKFRYRPSVERKTVTLINTPLISSCFRNGKYFDRYFTGIQGYTDKNIIFLPSINKNTDISWHMLIDWIINNVEYRFILKEWFLNIFDYLLLWKYYFKCLKYSKKKYYFENDDVTEIVKYSLLKGSSCTPSVRGLLDYVVIKRIKDYGYNIENFISWYEGRPNDIIACKAFRQFYPQSQCVGYEGFAMSDNMLSLFISNEQFLQHSCPNCIAIGSYAYKKYATEYCDKIDVVMTPILRTDLKFHTHSKNMFRKHTTILLVLSYFYDNSKRIIEMVNAVLHDKNDIFQVFVKNHPVNFGKDVAYYTSEELCFEPHYVDGDLSECLQDIDVAITSKSTAVVEIMCQGVFLIEVFNLNEINITVAPVSEFENMYACVYDEFDLEAILEKKKYMDTSTHEEFSYVDRTKDNVMKLWR